MANGHGQPSLCTYVCLGRPPCQPCQPCQPAVPSPLSTLSVLDSHMGRRHGPFSGVRVLVQRVRHYSTPMGAIARVAKCTGACRIWAAALARHGGYHPMT